ncbi:type VI secretion system baseplate subunit TssF [Mucilaginibacter lappiensis]|uniref:Uncharacterized protein n=1 Tax=Mucilaginibacter lappiensis TaxID=354630 RepID=A0A1N7EHK0_9SPHI|nr:type VI secretion system baseplate subunit TssF [Mucilaginibacter lappiensis]MBB6111786.1 hypothetical protein [Mucilaginibacter lappiensis]MBB6128351.1 hypothetical protein [Mucilaginibacter lappiensis]SIR87556.1 hypothetical protein SAMN05421821_11467 [Mucilaginibacter lappiensis]
MNKLFFTSKEEIKGRMLRNAMDFWNTTNINDIDPLVKLLIDALSTELFNLSNDVKNLENRVLNKISRILASDYLTAPLPAHALLKGIPVENTETLSIKNHFIYRKTVSPDAGKTALDPLDIFFTPIGENKVFKAEIKYTFSGRQLWEHTPDMQKTPVASSLPQSFTENNTLWVGIETDPKLNTLQNAGVYFEWPGYTTNNDFYNLLPVTRLYTDEQELHTTSGLIYEEEEAIESKPVFYDQNIINLITRDVKSYYQTRFISLTDDSLNDLEPLKKSYPLSFERWFEPTDLKRLKPCVWIKMVFPAVIRPDVISELQLHLNCFPVMSRKLHEQKFRVKEMNNIIPIKPSAYDHFLSVQDLHDDLDIHYNEIPYSQADQNFEGSYSVRNGGAERFDSRNAQQIIEYLFELLRDEKAAFAAYGNDFLNSTLKTLEQNISLIEKKSNQAKDNHELINYLILKPANKAGMLYLQFWTTLADTANNIRKGSRLQQFETTKLKADNLRLMTTSIGGRNSLGATERIQAYKYGLTTKDRIVTQADLTSFCQYELGTKLKSIRISKGVSISPNPKEGFKKTTDIYLKPHEESKLSTNEWDTLLSLLQSKLESRSIINYNYRLFIEN